MTIPYLDADYLGNRGDLQSTFEPQRANNGYLLLPLNNLVDQNGNKVADDKDVQVLTLTAKGFPLPSDMSNVFELSHQNEKRKFAASVMVDDVDVMFEQMVAPNVATILQRWRNAVYDPLTGRNGWARDYKLARAHFVLIPPDGSATRDNIDTRTIYPVVGAFPTRFARGDFDSATDDVVRITMTLSIDKVLPAQTNMANAETVGGGARIPLSSGILTTNP